MLYSLLELPLLQNELMSAVLRHQEENTRQSKTQARIIQRGAWNATLAQRCEHAQLALACLKHPSAELSSLLEAWRSHMTSEAFRTQRPAVSWQRPSALLQRPGVFNSGALQPADERPGSFPISVAFYNVGLQNNEVHAKRWDNDLSPLIVCSDAVLKTTKNISYRKQPAELDSLSCARIRKCSSLL